MLNCRCCIDSFVESLNAVAWGHHDPMPLHWPNFDLGGPVHQKPHTGRQQPSTMTASKTTAHTSPTPKLPSELLHPDKLPQSLRDLPGTIGMQDDQGALSKKFLFGQIFSLITSANSNVFLRVPYLLCPNNPLSEAEGTINVFEINWGGTMGISEKLGGQM